jgi:Mn2+/Fe2+ NRAMP family transporter
MKFLKRSKTRILLFLAVVGPGFITANVDNDAGGIFTYSQAGAQFGHLLLWTMIPITLALIVVQEMCSRMGAVTGKGLSDLIREEFGFRITFFMMIGILIINFGNVVTEFIGIATSLESVWLPAFITVPVCAVIVWLIVVKGQLQERGERFFSPPRFSTSPTFSPECWRILCGRTRTIATDQTARPAAPFKEQATLFMVIGVVGHDHRALDAVLPAVIGRGEGRHQSGIQSFAARCDHGMRFYRRRGLVHHRRLRRHAVGSRLPRHQDAADAAQALRPLAGDYAYILFAVGLFNASLFAASILPLSTAYTVCEGLGFESPAWG